MFRKATAIMVIFLLLFSLCPIGVNATENVPEGREKTVKFIIGQERYEVGDKSVKTDVAPYIKDVGNGGGRTMVPVAFVAPALGTEPAIWLPTERAVQIKKGSTEIRIVIDSKELLVNGKAMQMDVAAEIVEVGNGGGRTMLPIAFIARALEVGYQWNGATSSVDFYGYTKTYEQKGTFGPDAGIDTIEGNVIVKADGVVLQNTLIKGNLTIAEEVGDGNVTLNNITVIGETFVRGGGKDSIHINGGQYSSVIVDNVNGQVRIVAVDVNGLTVVVTEAAAGEEIILEGQFQSVSVDAENLTVTLNPGTVVNTMVLNSQADIKGTGTILNAEVNADGVTFTKAPEQMAVDPTVETPPSTSTGGGSSGGGGGGDTPVPAKEITSYTALAAVDLDADEYLVDLATLKASSKLPTTVTVTDGTTPATANITDWTGTFDGTTTGANTLTAVWTMPAGYADATEPISVTVTVNVNVAQNIYVELTGVGINVAAGTITGTTTAMQYSLDSTDGTDGTWADCTADNTAVTFVVGKVYVRAKTQPTNFRLAATVAAPAAAPTSGVTYSVVAGTVTGLGTDYEYSINGGAWSTTATGVEFVEGPVTVRTKATASALPSEAETIGTVAAPAAAPSLDFDDVDNSITGLDATYEYKIDDGAWTSGEIAGDFTGDKTVLVRLKATASTLPSQNQTINFTANLDLTGVGINVAAGTITGTTTAMQYSLDSTDGTDGTWADCTADNTAVTFVVGKVYVRAKTQPTNFRLAATVAAPAAAPISGVTYSVVAGTVTGLGTDYEYSINGGAWSTTATGVEFVEGPVTVRTKATASALPSEAETIGTVAAPAAAPSLDFDDVDNSITGLDATYEYKIDDGAWTSGEIAGDFTGDKTVLVRLKATASTLPSQNQTINFTANLDLTGVGINVAAGTITGTTTAMQYSLDSTDGTDGTWADCTADNTAVTFVVGKVYVRAKTQPTNFRLAATVAAPAAAPISGVTYSVVAGTVTGLGTDYEYSINGGAWSTTATGVEFVEGPVTVRTKATASALPSEAETIGTVAAPAAAPSLDFDDVDNSITGLDATYEYKIDDGAWTSGEIAGDFTGDKTVLVRLKATASTLPSQNQTINFTANLELTGVGINVAAGTITGTTTAMQYSLDSTDGTDGTWADCTADNTAVTFVVGKVYVRAKTQPLNFRLVATVAAPAAAPELAYDDVANTILGLDGTYEYKIDGGDWISGDIAGDFTGDKTVLVRIKATASALPSQNQTIIFTANLDLAGVGINVAAGTITGTTTAMQYSLDSTDGTDGSWADCTAANTTVSFAPGNVYVRAKAQAANYRLVATVAAPAAAPTSGVSYNVAAGTVTGLGTEYEYSINGGAWSTAASGVVFVAGPVTVRTEATAAALPSEAETIGTIAAPAAAPELAYDDVANTILGLDGTYEYKIDGGDWTSGDIAGDFTGDKTVLVRLKATASALPSQNQTITFTSSTCIDIKVNGYSGVELVTASGTTVADFIATLSSEDGSIQRYYIRDSVPPLGLEDWSEGARAAEDIIQNGDFLCVQSEAWLPGDEDTTYAIYPILVY